MTWKKSFHQDLVLFFFIFLLACSDVLSRPVQSSDYPDTNFSRLLAFNMGAPAGLFGNDDDSGPLSALEFAQSVRKQHIEEFEAAREAYIKARHDYDWFAAEKAGRKARLMAEDNNEPFNLGLADTLLGTALVQQSRFSEAEPILVRAQETLQKEKGTKDIYTLWASARLAEIRLKQGRLAESLKMGEKLPDRATGKASKSELIAALQDARYWPAQAALQLGRFDKAEAIIELILEDTKNDKHKLVLRERAKAFQLASDFYKGINQGELAISNARDSLKLRRKSDPRSGFEVQGMISLANKLQTFGRGDEAESIIKEAVRLARQSKSSDQLTLGRALLLQAIQKVKNNKSGDSDKDLSKALDIFRAANAREELVVASRQLARFRANQGNSKQAISLYREALDNIDYMFAATRGLVEASRQYFLDIYIPYYHEAVRYLLSLENKNAGKEYGRLALEAVSRTQSRIFTELLRQSLAGRETNDPSFRKLLDKRETSQRRFDGFQERLLRLPSDKNDPMLSRRINAIAEGLKNGAEKSQKTLAQLNQRLWSEYPRYMELTEPRPVTVKALQNKHLQDDETLLGYYLQPNQVVIFVIAKNQFLVRAVTHDENEISSRIKRVRRAMNFESLLDPSDLYRLYQLLLEPVADNLPQKGKLITVGDGPLHALPLEMLVTEWTKKDQDNFRSIKKHRSDFYANLKYTADRWNFSYMPSFAAFVALREAGKRLPTYKENMVSFADPVFDMGSTAQMQAGKTRSDILIRLEETANEARQIAGIIGGDSDLFIRDAAQEFRAKAIDHGEARYLHFATHGLLGGQFLQVKTEMGQTTSVDTNMQSRLNSDTQPALVLSLSGDMRGEDGFLTLSDVIADLKTDAELVVLSACNTAGEGGEPGGGEGFTGMTRAFMYAGASGLYVSHWSVESNATLDLMLEAFKRLKENMTPVEALAEARAVIRRTPGRGNPVFWAPFVYLGK
ncbi:MAG: CHAT domain-containing protein [Gammaproteobacteria bacterium]|nr:CHAT domain-containing protein [Gammaproteobacteria bacterium]